MAAFPVQLAATWPGVEPVEAADVLTPAAIERLDHLRTERLAGLVHVFGGDPARWVRADGFTTPGVVGGARSVNRPARREARRPSLIVHGEDDEAVRRRVDPQPGRPVAAAGDDVELRTYAGADHMGVADAAARRRRPHRRRLPVIGRDRADPRRIALRRSARWAVSRCGGCR